MSAADSFRLTVRRGSPGPALLAIPGRVDQVELVDITTGEAVLFWEGTPAEAGRLAKALRRDLRSMNATTFRAAWLEDRGQPRP